MKPIQKGMNEAITRDGQKVTQLTWFNVKEGECVAGLLDGELHMWYENGNYWLDEESNNDIFAMPQYKYQCLVKQTGTRRYETTSHYEDEQKALTDFKFVHGDDWEIVSRIDQSRIEVE